MTATHSDITLIRPARLPRRLLGLSIDVLCCALPVWLLLVTDTLSRKAFNPEPGWFYSEWLLKLWLDHPPYILAPILWWIIFALIWQLLWEATLGKTPGAMLVRIQPVSATTGKKITLLQAALRSIGALLNILSLGLGYALCFIFMDGIALHEVISRSVTAVKPRQKHTSAHLKRDKKERNQIKTKEKEDSAQV